jgi:hypothetical protein
VPDYSLPNRAGNALTSRLIATLDLPLCPKQFTAR